MLFLLVTNSCPTFCNPMDCHMPDFPVLHYLSELAQTHIHWVDDAIQPSHPLSPPSPPAFKSFPASGSFPMSRLFRWPKYWSLSFSPSNEYSGLISFRIDCFDLLIVQGTLKSLLQNRNWKAESISSLALSLLYGPALTFVHDSWKNQSFE